MVPLVTLPARFGARGVAAGVAFTAPAGHRPVGLRRARDASRSHRRTPSAPTLLMLAAALAIPCPSALMRSDLEHRTEAVIDDLTGMLANRRALEQRLEELEAQAVVGGQSVAAIAADIDHFKRVNDEHGHARGDDVLVEVAYRLRSRLRAFDLAYRVGGEEFLVLLPGAGMEEARILADALRDAVVADRRSTGWPVTVSFGVAATGGGRFDGEALLAQADAALYVAKAHGRDCVVVA